MWNNVDQVKVSRRVMLNNGSATYPITGAARAQVGWLWLAISPPHVAQQPPETPRHDVSPCRASASSVRERIRA
jgi:hypothetical protein